MRPFIKIIIRRILNIIPQKAVVFILSGPLRGMRWVKGSGVNGYWIGTYEKGEAEKFSGMISKNDVVFDVGAQAGYYSLIAARKGAKVFAFEPLEENIKNLEKNAKLNNLNIKIFPYAVSDKSGTVLFGKVIGGSPLEARIGQGKEISCVTLDEIIEKESLLPSVIKIDAEGYEDNVLIGGGKFIRKCHPKLMVATTGETSVDLVKSLGYSKINIINNNSIFAE